MNIKIERLSNDIVSNLNSKELGHCLCIQDLSKEESLLLIKKINETANKIESYIIGESSDLEKHNRDYIISHDMAIELRNRKKNSLCLIFLPGIDIPASLSNTFEFFDSIKFLNNLKNELMNRLDGVINQTVKKVLKQARSGQLGKDLMDDQIVNFLSTIINNPTLKNIGKNLWIIGLIPDNSEEFIERINLNYNCVLEITKPTILHHTIRQRLENAKLKKSTIFEQINNFLESRNIFPIYNWLEDLGRDENLTFDNWEFPEIEDTDLIELKLKKPKRNEEGRLNAGAGDLFIESADSPIIAKCGKGRKINIAWETIPKQPKNVGEWLIELIPSIEDYGVDENQYDLPQVRVKPEKNTAKISLDIELDEIYINWVQIRVVPLDKNGNSFNTIENFEVLSERIILSQSNEEESVKPKQTSYINLPLAILEVLLKSKRQSSKIDKKPPIWKNDDYLSYYNVLINEKNSCQIVFSNFIKIAEKRLLNKPDLVGKFYYDLLDIENPNYDELIELSIIDEKYNEKEYIRNFLNRRKELFSKINNQDLNRGFVEVCEWGGLNNKVKNYVDSYNSLLENLRIDETIDISNRKSLLIEILNIDTIKLKLYYSTGTQEAILLMPTHPYRLLWYFSYSILIDQWSELLLNNVNKVTFDLELLKQVNCTNIPIMIPTDNNCNKKNDFIFVNNINFFVGLYLPIDSDDWARVGGDIIKFLGYSGVYSINEIKVTDIVEILKRYMSFNKLVFHRGINVGIINPGTGELIASALEKISFDETSEDELLINSINIAALANEPLPVSIESFDRLNQKIYFSENIADNNTALKPAFSQYLSKKNIKPEFPNGYQNTIFYFNSVKPTFYSIKEREITDNEGVNLYGLVNRWSKKSFTKDGEFVTLFWFPKSKALRYEKHPVDSTLTDYLLDLKNTLSGSLSWIYRDKIDETLFGLRSVINQDQKQFIEYLHLQCDWLINIDRFVTPDYYDNPSDIKLASISEKYLIDYSPNYSEDIGEKLLVSTCFNDYISDQLSKRLQELIKVTQPYEITYLKEIIIKSLKIFSGSSFFSIHENDIEEINKKIISGFIIDYLKNSNELNGSFIFPYQNQNYSVTDLIIVKLNKDKLIFNCIEFQIKERIEESCEKIEKFIMDFQINFDLENPWEILERGDLVSKLKFFFHKAIRHGLIKNEDSELIDKYQEVFSRFEYGKAQIEFRSTVYSIDFDNHFSEKIVKLNEKTNVIIHSLFSLNLIKNITNEIINLEEGENELIKTNNENVMFENESILNSPIFSYEKLANQSSNYPESVPIELGTTNTGNTIMFNPSTKGSPHTLVLGIPGQGKSVTLNSILIQLAQHGVGTFVFDFHGQFSSLNYSFNRSLKPKIWDPIFNKLPFSPFEFDKNAFSQNDYSIKMLCNEIADVFEFVCELGTIQRYSLYETLVDLYKNKIDSNFQEFITIDALKQKLKTCEKNNNVKNVLARTSKILEMDFFAEKGEWDILDSTKNGLILNLKTVGEGTVQNAISAFVLRKLYKEILKLEETNKLKLAIVLDEAHRLSKDITLPLIMQEARKFGVMIVIASQNLNHFHQNIVQNVGTKILYRTNAPSSNVVGNLVTLNQGIDPRKIVQSLKVGQAIVQSPEMKYGSIVNMKMIK